LVRALANREIDQGQLQHYYLTHYSQTAIEKQWLDYLAS
jgi:hypothetical protein